MVPSRTLIPFSSNVHDESHDERRAISLPPSPRSTLQSTELSHRVKPIHHDASPQASSSHMMKTTKRGRPFLKVLLLSLHLYALYLLLFSLQDTLDLFASLVVSLQLSTHKQFFRSFPNSFSTCVSFSPCCSFRLSFPYVLSQRRSRRQPRFTQVSPI